MNNLTKSIASLLILNPVIAFSENVDNNSLVTTLAATADNSLASYLKDYHPKTYTAAQKNGVDINALEFAEPNINNMEKMALAEPRHDGSPQIFCKESGGIFLENNFIATCVTPDGTFGNGSQSLGMTFNPSGSGTITSPDYLRPGSPHEYFSVTFNQQLFTNNNRSGVDNIPTTVKPLNRSALQEGGALVESTIFGNAKKSSRLKIIQKYTVDPNSKEIIVRVEMQNTGRTILEGVTYARGLDPDQSRPDTFNTYNKRGHTYYSRGGIPIQVAPNNIAWASGKKGLSVALYSVDPVSHNTCISSTWTTDPVQILNQNCGTTSPFAESVINYSDSTINIAFKIGDLKPQETRVFSFKYLFNQEIKRIDPPVGINPPIIIDPPVGIHPPIIIGPIKPVLPKE